MHMFKVIAAFGRSAWRARREIRVILLFLILSSILASPLGTHAGQGAAESPHGESHRSIVFVIDVSTSMFDIMDTLKESLKAYLAESQPGDSVAVVTFGTSSSLHFRKTLHDESDKQEMLKFCEKLSCPDQYTYIPCGLNMGLRELHQFFQKDPSATHMLILMSDGRNNPPKGVDEDSLITYEAIKEKYFSKFIPGQDWYVNYVALRGTPDVKLKDFVKECQGNTIALHAEDQVEGFRNGRPAGDDGANASPLLAISEAEICPSPNLVLNGEGRFKLGYALIPIESKISLIVMPRKGHPKGQRLRIEPVLDNFLMNKNLIVKVQPDVIECDDVPKPVEISLSIEGVWDKEIVGALAFRPIEKSILLVHPQQIRFRFMETVKLFIGRYSPELNQEYRPIDWVALGPLEPGKACTEKFALSIQGKAPSERISIDVNPDISLPEDVTITTDVNLSGLLSNQAYITITATAGENASLRDGQQFTGNLVLVNPKRAISFSQAILPLKIFTVPATAKGKWTFRNTTYYKKIEANWKFYGMSASVVLLVLGLLSGLGYVRYKAYMSKFVPAEGWLVLLESPPDLDMASIDLKEMSEKLKKSTLIVGSDPSCDIVLPDKTIDKSHAQLRSGREGTPTPVYLKSVELSDIKVNHHLLDEEITLQDRDIIEIGPFQFLYSNSHLKQIVVHYTDGDVKYGVPMTWNIEEEGFLFRPEGKGAEDLQVFIPFRDLKAVFFVKDFDKEIARKIKRADIYAKKDRIAVTFRDGECIEGFTMRKFDPEAARFLMVPKERPDKEENNICVLVEKKFTTDVKFMDRTA